MQNELIQQWTDRTKSSVEAFKKFSETSTETISRANANLFDLKPWAQVGKAAMEASSELRRFNESMLNQAIQVQVETINIEAFTTTVKDFGEVTTDSMSRFMKLYTDIIHASTEGISGYLETIKKSRSANDIAAAQMNLFTVMQAKMKDSTLDTIMLFEGIKTALNGLAEKTIDGLLTEPPAPKTKIAEIEP